MLFWAVASIGRAVVAIKKVANSAFLTLLRRMTVKAAELFFIAAFENWKTIIGTVLRAFTLVHLLQPGKASALNSALDHRVAQLAAALQLRGRCRHT